MEASNSRLEGSSPLRVFELFPAQGSIPAPNINILWISWGRGPRACADRSFAYRVDGRTEAQGQVSRSANCADMSAVNDLARQIQGRLSARTRQTIHDATLRRAAVLVPVLDYDGEPGLLFTRRTETVETHKGQISFPGGATDPGDADSTATALRETHEELGIPPGAVEVLGALDDLPTTVSGFVVAPVVGIIPYPYPFRVNSAEIAEILPVPLRVFRDPSRLRVERHERAGALLDVYFYRYDGEEIWGLTARIMKGFIDAIFG